MILADGEYAYGEYGDYESVGTPFGAARFSWVKKKKSRLESVASMRYFFTFLRVWMFFFGVVFLLPWLFYIK